MNLTNPARLCRDVVPLGIPHSVFLDWDPDDQDKALVWMRRTSGGSNTTTEGACQ